MSQDMVPKFSKIQTRKHHQQQKPNFLLIFSLLLLAPERPSPPWYQKPGSLSREEKACQPAPAPPADVNLSKSSFCTLTGGNCDWTFRLSACGRKLWSNLSSRRSPINVFDVPAEGRDLHSHPLPSPYPHSSRLFHH